MANTRSLSTATPLTSASGSAPVAVPSPGASPRHRLRAVGRDEVVDITDFLPPGATWLPAPQHTLPTLPGRPPMVGYLVLVPADQQPPVLPFVVADEKAVDHAGSAAGAGSGEAGDELVRVDTAQRTAEVGGRPLDLTYLEFELLAHLVAHPNRVHTRDQLVTTVWGYGHVGDGRTVDVHIARLRRKLGGEFRQAIQTVRRVGYKYTPPLGR
ncbi:winged helix-turn-helix domain-containing protein [Streptomyces europaeiscabiei]|uniref:Winged helix-turn-helix domain-containing protein n=1 Tax=Streptomyces europaeiscabiei TaxID=146819 RepID=A0ABU4N8C9_9ACTN|nr:winged helix-turn-helix domain-containing protein [Streptomyces europaeiscabiei]MDX2524192.1 winged helix-turn-helix domain-containing protein [Streptomyces europaeiscabiei]MDX2763933.1 winged helix-turn-helix domain-containing protein [Streptomyces europaeiscabiei]MDX2773572.1 winged helix-turn-helix domain-containing protein [Streptomyces europaeiscabiei]MDX3545457.1 winged helix-turn-helix domain-containing protein [Streptomyces europaeiscabiei]MDX3554448.1 winged helix-turn-helix domain